MRRARHGRRKPQVHAPRARRGPALPTELIVVTRAETAMRASAGRFEALSGEPTATLASLLADHGATMSPLFGATEERVIASSLTAEFAPAGDPAGLSTFYSVAAAPEALDSLQADLLGHDLVDGGLCEAGERARRPSERHGAHRRRSSRGQPRFRRAAALSRRRPRRRRGALGVDAGGRARRRHPHHRHRRRLALHARGSEGQPGRRGRRDDVRQHRLAQPRHRGARRI